MAIERRRMIKTIGILTGASCLVLGTLMFAGAVITRHSLHVQSGFTHRIFWAFGEPFQYVLPGFVLLVVGCLLIVLSLRHGKAKH